MHVCVRAYMRNGRCFPTMKSNHILKYIASIDYIVYGCILCVQDAGNQWSRSGYGGMLQEC